jgi:hypothetical protein
MRAVIFLSAVCACSGLPKQQEPGVVTVELTAPTGGTELVAGDTPMITVTGTVATTNPKYGTLVAWVNGTAVTLDTTGAFSTQVTPALGINHIKVEASDGFGTIVSKELDVLWAPDYLPPTAGTAGFQVPDALDLYLGQRFFDGRMLGTTLDMSTDPVVAHDLAAALELILWNIDLASLINGGIHVGTGSSTLDINIPAATPAEIVVDTPVIQSPESAIDLSMDLNGVYLATTGQFHYSNKTLTVAGGISADMHASAHMAIAVQADGSIAVTVSNVTAVVGPLTPQFTGPDANTLDGFITVGNNDFRTLVEGIIQQQLIPTFTNKIPPLLETLLGATGKLLNNVSFSLDSKLGTPVMLTLNGKVGALDVVQGPAIGLVPGHITVRQGVSITTDAATPVHSESHGAMRVSAMPMMPVSTAGLDVLMSQDFFNAMLHSLWNSGLLDGSAALGGINATVTTKLQPVVIPTPDDSDCTVDGVRCDLIVQIGQLEVQLPDFMQSFTLDATAGARVVVNGTTVSLVISQTPDIHVWETSQVPGRLSTQAVHDIVSNVVWPQLFGAIGANLHITLPIPDLSTLGLDQLSPNLANAKLSLDVRQQAGVSDGFLELGADLSLSTPHP